MKKEVTKLFSATGVTPRNNRDLLSRKVPGRLNASRLRVLLLGEELAKQNFYPVLDIFYRDPLSALSCNIALVRGKAEENDWNKNRFYINCGLYSKYIRKCWRLDNYSKSKHTTDTPGLA